MVTVATRFTILFIFLLMSRKSDSMIQSSYTCFIFRRERHTSPSSPHDHNPHVPQLWLAALLEEEAINSMDYEFNFQLEIRAPYLLAGQRIFLYFLLK